MPFPTVGSRTRNGLDQGIRFIRSIRKRNIVPIYGQIFCHAVNGCCQIVLVFRNILESPFLDIAVFRNKQDSVMIQHIRPHEHI